MPPWRGCDAGMLARGTSTSRERPGHATLFELGEVIAAHSLAGRVVPELNDKTGRERFLHSFKVAGASPHSG